ncbi:MAG: hypothetical protein JWM19_2796 [Actinomycetia bacterium]|nr:hypothetical protein [Actinomycetes bacterium]
MGGTCRRTVRVAALVAPSQRGAPGRAGHGRARAGPPPAELDHGIGFPRQRDRGGRASRDPPRKRSRGRDQHRVRRVHELDELVWQQLFNRVEQQLIERSGRYPGAGELPAKRRWRQWRVDIRGHVLAEVRSQKRSQKTTSFRWAGGLGEISAGTPSEGRRRISSRPPLLEMLGWAWPRAICQNVRTSCRRRGKARPGSMPGGPWACLSNSW